LQLRFEPWPQDFQLWKSQFLANPPSFVRRRAFDVAFDGKELANPDDRFGCDGRRVLVQDVGELATRMCLMPSSA